MSPELVSSSKDRQKEVATKDVGEKEERELAEVDELAPYYNDQ